MGNATIILVVTGPIRESAALLVQSGGVGGIQSNPVFKGF
jgi:hypothetical protein